MDCDYPEIISEVTPPRGQKAGEGVWDNSRVGFHSLRPGIGYRGGVKVVSELIFGATGVCVKFLSAV